MKLGPITPTIGRKLIAILIALCFVPALSACEQPDWKNPDYISKRLVEGDATSRSMAIKKLGQLDEEKQKKVAPALAKVYLEGDQNQKDAMQILVQLRVPEAKDAYMKEVEENATGYAAAAAEALGEAGVKEALPDMIALYKSTDDNDLKQGLLRAFAYMPDAKLVGLLTETLELDVDNNPIALHAYSCEIMGEIAQESPGAINERAQKAMVKSLYVGNMAGQTVSKECGLALQQLGDPAIPLLLKTFKGENEQVQSLLLKYNKPPKFQFPENRSKAVAAVRLSALKAKKAVDPFLKDLASTKEAPEQLSGNHAIRWRVTEAQATSEIINGLGFVGNDKSAEVLAGIVKKEKIEEEWDEITDYQVELQLRQDAAFSLVRMGAREQAGALLEMAKDGVIADLEKLAVQAQGTKREMKITDRYQFNWMMAQQYAFLTDAKGLDGLVALIKDTKEPELKKKYETFVAPIKEGGECLGKGKPSAQADCFGKLLTSKNELVQKKAAYELGRLPAQVAGPIIAEHLAHEKLQIREILNYSAYKAPHKSQVAAIDKLLEEEEADDTPRKLDHYRMKLLRAWLKNNSAGVAQK